MWHSLWECHTNVGLSFHFSEQISRGILLTITNPKMTRFMMSLTNAVDLVLYAENGNNGDHLSKSTSSYYRCIV